MGSGGELPAVGTLAPTDTDELSEAVPHTPLSGYADRSAGAAQVLHLLGVRHVLGRRA